MDGSLYVKFKFFDSFFQADLKNFTFNKAEERFPKLVNMFYDHLSYKEGVIKTEVCKKEFTISLEKFADISNLPCAY